MYKIVNEMIYTSLPHYNSNSLCTMLKWTIIKALISKSKDLGYTWPGLSEVQRNVRDPRGGWSEPHGFVQGALSGHSERPAEAVLS